MEYMHFNILVEKMTAEDASRFLDIVALVLDGMKYEGHSISAHPENDENGCPDEKVKNVK